MKRMLLFMCVLGPLAHAQVIDFSDTTGGWFVADTYPYGSIQDPGFTQTVTTTYFYNGDTTLVPDLWSVMMANPFVEVGGMPARIGWSRTVDDRVFFRDSTGAVAILYDFSLQGGDSVFYPEPINDFLRVAQVNSISIAGVPHRLIDFEPYLGLIPASLEERWIEGIGSIHGPLFPRYPRSFSTEVPGDSLMLTCYERAGALLWDHPGYPACTVNIIQSNRDLPRAKDQLNVWPNPGYREIHVAWGTGTSGVIVRDLQGKIILRSKLQGGLCRIDTSALEKAMYIVQLIDSDGTQVYTKWIKQ